MKSATALLGLLLPLASLAQTTTDPTGSNEWYVVFPDKCQKDCNDPADPDCGGLTTDPSTYSTATLCCEAKLSWIVLGLCEANSQDAIAEYLGTEEYYAVGSEEKCVKDCDVAVSGDEECGGVVLDVSTETFGDVASCCAAKLGSLNEDFCESNSDPLSTGTGLYFPDSTLGYCVLDEDDATCPADTTCARATSRDSDLFATTTECCTSKFNYITLEICEAAGGFTDLWHVDYPNNVCKLDCDPATAADPTICGAPAVTDVLYDEPEDCCDEKLGTVQYCAEYSQNVDPAGSLEWYVNHADGKCSKDCPEDPSGDLACGGLATPDVTLYADEVLCCAGGLASVSSEFCEATSLVEEFLGTGLYYTDGINNRCVEDCESGATPLGAGTCGGIIEDASVTLHADSLTCCQTTLSYLDEDFCVDNSLDVPLGTQKFLADTAGFCALDTEACDPASMVCDRATANDKLYDDISTCCASMPYMTTELCETRSEFGEYTNLWFLDGTLKCALDCEVGTDPACEDVPSLDITLYDDHIICCDENLSSLKDEYCEDISLGEEHLGIGEYYTDFINNRCVADCAEGEVAEDTLGACGGIITDASVPLFADAATCCSDTLTSLDPDFCADRSLFIPAGTGKYFADPSGFCVMDDVDLNVADPCDPATEVCGTASASVKLYDTVETCCATMPYITTELCETRSLIDTYTGLFFVAGPMNCAVDCDPADGPPCTDIPSMDITLFADAATCCEEKLSFVASEYCEAVSNGEDFPGTFEYYTDGTNNRCVADCAEGEVAEDGVSACGGIITDASVPLFADAATCCVETLSYVDEDFCVDRSLDAPIGTGKYFSDPSGFCVMDDADLNDVAPCNPAAEICGTASASVKLYDTVDTCCATMPYITTELCETRSLIDTYTGLFFVAGPMNCAVDCDPAGGPPCTDIPSMDITLFADEVTCCEEKLSFVASEYCEALSLGEVFEGTELYYTDFINNRCVADCVEGDVAADLGACGGIITDASVTLYDDAAACCTATLSTVDIDFCEDRSLDIPVGTLKYFADSAGFCALDVIPCDPTAQVCGEAAADDMLSVDAAACCADSLPYITTELCETRSIDTYTDSWFVDGLLCAQDCDPADGPPCAEVTDMGTDIFDTADLCCAEKLSFMDSDQCIAISDAGSIEGYDGSNKWHGAGENKCVMDCAEGSAQFCGGIVDPNSELLFDDAVSCCAGKYSYVDEELCVALSTETFTNKFYVDYPSMVCKQHCEDTGTPPCGGDPTEITMELFDDLATCCDEKLDWVYYCEDDSMDIEPVGTSQFYVDYSRMLCVQDCQEADGAPCGGVIPGSWVQLHATPDACCLAHLEEQFNDPEQECVLA